MARLKLYHNISELLTLKKAQEKSGRFIQEEDLSIIKKAALVVESGKIVFVGRQGKALDRFLLKKKKAQVTQVDMQGRVVLPGFIESHTHLVFAGDRSREFEQRVRGATYQEIAQAGGGILSTVKATRKAKENELLESAQLRVRNFLKQGVVGLEVKSGYGLNFKTERKMLRVIRQLKGCSIKSTYLAAHACPPEWKGDFGKYLDSIIHSDLPKLAKEKLIDRVDIFIEKNYFTKAQARELFITAQSYGLELTAHVEQLSRQGGTALGVKHNISSADHIVEVSSKDIQALAQSEVTGVLLPTADFYLRMKYPKARQMIEAGVRVALATDFNPGSSPTQDLSLVGVLARNEMRMSLPEVIVAYTLGGAYALNWQQDLGSLTVGRKAKMAVLDDHWSKLFYQVGYHPVSVLS